MRIFRTCPKGGISRYQQVEKGELAAEDI